MKDLGITKGEWIVDKTTVYSLHQVGWHKGNPLMSNRFYLQVYPDYRVENCNVEAVFNAKLIADAGNTAQECGLLPSELLAQRDELLETLKAIYPKIDHVCYEPVRSMVNDAIKKLTK